MSTFCCCFFLFLLFVEERIFISLRLAAVSAFLLFSRVCRQKYAFRLYSEPCSCCTLKKCISTCFKLVFLLFLLKKNFKWKQLTQFHFLVFWLYSDLLKQQQKPITGCPLFALVYWSFLSIFTNLKILQTKKLKLGFFQLFLEWRKLERWNNASSI